MYPQVSHFCHFKQKYLKGFLSKRNLQRWGTRSVDVNLPLPIFSQIQPGQEGHWIQNNTCIFNTLLGFLLKIFSAALVLRVWIFALIWFSFKSNTSSAVCGWHPFNQLVHFHTCAEICPSITCPSSLALCKDLGWITVQKAIMSLKLCRRCCSKDASLFRCFIITRLRQMYTSALIIFKVSGMGSWNCIFFHI